MRTAYVIDFSNFACRFKVSHKRLTCDLYGVQMHTGVLAGMLYALQHNRFTDIFIVLDGTPAMPRVWLPSYKGQRSQEQDDVVFVPLSDCVKFFSAIGDRIGKNIHVLCAPNEEADYVISSFTHLACGKVSPLQVEMDALSKTPNAPQLDSKLLPYSEDASISVLEDWNFDQVVLATTDSDMFQLLDLSGETSVVMDSSTVGSSLVAADNAVTPASVKNVPYSQVAAYKMFFGDSGDNVPRVSIPGLSDSEVMDILPLLNTVEKRQKFISYLRNNSLPLLDSRLQSVSAKIISADKVHELERNAKVTGLAFSSVPFLLTYPEFDADSIICRYSLRYEPICQV